MMLTSPPHSIDIMNSLSQLILYDLLLFCCLFFCYMVCVLVCLCGRREGGRKEIVLLYLTSLVLFLRLSKKSIIPSLLSKEMCADLRQKKCNLVKQKQEITANKRKRKKYLNRKEQLLCLSITMGATFFAQSLTFPKANQQGWPHLMTKVVNQVAITAGRF